MLGDPVRKTHDTTDTFDVFLERAFFFFFRRPSRYSARSATSDPIFRTLFDTLRMRSRKGMMGRIVMMCGGADAGLARHVAALKHHAWLGQRVWDVAHPAFATWQLQQQRHGQ